MFKIVSVWKSVSKKNKATVCTRITRGNFIMFPVFEENNKKFNIRLMQQFLFWN